MTERQIRADERRKTLEEVWKWQLENGITHKECFIKLRDFLFTLLSDNTLPPTRSEECCGQGFEIREFAQCFGASVPRKVCLGCGKVQ